MRKRRLLLLAVLGLLALAGWVITFIAPRQAAPGTPINERNFQRIYPGMPRGDVEALLGAPGTDYGAGEIASLTRLSGSPGGGGGKVRWDWYGPATYIHLEYDADDRVARKEFGAAGREPIPGVRLRRWLGF
jgi:hypothetical protein